MVFLMKKKDKTKNKIINLFLLIIFLILIVLVYKYSYVKEIKDNVKFSNEYPSINKNNNFKYIDIDDAINIIENKTGLIYFGFPECIWCQKYIIYLNEIINEEKIKNVYYLNIKNDRNENNKSYQKLTSIIKDYLIDQETNQLYVPAAIIIKDGNIIYSNNDTSSIKDNVTADEYWTNDRINDFKNRLKNAIEEIK